MTKCLVLQELDRAYHLQETWSDFTVKSLLI